MRFGPAAGSKAKKLTPEEIKKQKADSLPWNEKFRPKNLDEVAYQTDVVAALRRVLVTANLPHLLFYGPPGTGKTSTVLALSRELYGPKLWRTRTLELNASDERGINIVRHKVKNFAKLAVGTSGLDPKYPCPPFKILVLDEADAMTRDAQSALRRTMEKWSQVTRFALICNYVSRIIAPITSRCAKFRFQPLPSEHIAKKLRFICDAEKINASDGCLKALEDVSGGDMRKAITFLQCASHMADAGSQLEAAHVNEVTVTCPPQFVDEIFKECMTGQFQNVYDAAEKTVKEGMPIAMLLEALHDRVAKSTVLSEEGKAEAGIALAVCDWKLDDGADEYLQFLNALCSISKAVSVKG